MNDLNEEAQLIATKPSRKVELFELWEGKLRGLGRASDLSDRQAALLSLLTEDYRYFVDQAVDDLDEQCRLLEEDFEEDVSFDFAAGFRSFLVLDVHSLNLDHVGKDDVWSLDLEGPEDTIIHLYYRALEFDYIALTH